MSKKLKILLYADVNNNRVGQGAPYVKFLSQFGEIILVTVQNDLDFFIGAADVLAVPGGADVDPARYGGVPDFEVKTGNYQYEYLDENLLRKWITTGKPIIGICRGLQTLNVELGGTLFQDIYNHVGSGDRADDDHELCTFIPGFESIKVNSYHHQAIKKLGEGLEVIGWSPVYQGCPSLVGDNRQYLVRRPMFSDKDKKKGNHHITSSAKNQQFMCLTFPEIIRHKTKPYIAFQYHPEESSCELATKLIKETLAEYAQSKNTSREYAALPAL